MLRGNFLIPDIENYTVMVSECPNKTKRSVLTSCASGYPQRIKVATFLVIFLSTAINPNYCNTLNLKVEKPVTLTTSP